MEQVEEICNHIVLVNLGKKILDGTVQDVKQQFKENKFSLKLHQTPANIESNAFTITAQKDNALTVKINTGFTSNDVLQHFINQQVAVESFNEILPSLNEIFIGLVEGTKAKLEHFKPLNRIPTVQECPAKAGFATRQLKLNYKTKLGSKKYYNN
jgi:ABC-2 type transport system ATP-binding protein